MIDPERKLHKTGVFVNVIYRNTLDFHLNTCKVKLGLNQNTVISVSYADVDIEYFDEIILIRDERSWDTRN